jgi:hypothetical protein
MGFWSYYAPLWGGFLLVLALNDTVRAAVRETPPWNSPVGAWTVVILLGLALGINFQLLFVGAQGAFAQVLPVPWGKSVRGRPAVVGGWLLMLAMGLGLITAALLWEAVTVAGSVVGMVGGAALALFAVVYVWSLPAAVADFGRERPTARGG